VATGAGASREGDVRARVDGNAVILVRDACSRDIYVSRLSDVKPVRVLVEVRLLV
jgi:hypothetical protein